MASRTELICFGLTRGEIDHGIGRGFLTPLNHGVYAVGRPTVTERGRWRAAVLACGPGAVLSHWHAAALWGMWKAAGTHGSRQCRPLSRRHARRHAPPSASSGPSRSDHPQSHSRHRACPDAVDLAGVASPRVLGELVEEAVRLELVDRDSLNAALGRHRGWRGVAELRRIDASTTRTRSKLEALYLRLCRQEDLPSPLINDVVAAIEVDAAFPEYRVAVELDGYGYHGAWVAGQRDHRSAATLSAAGLELLRFDWEQVTGAPRAVVAATIAALRRGGWSEPSQRLEGRIVHEWRE